MDGLIKNGAIYKLIQNELNDLPGEKSHLEMIPKRMKRLNKDMAVNSPKLSAILCLLYKAEEEINIILMERQDDGGKHAGQISFPGGKKELTDPNLEVTALRETEEEIGINSQEVNLLGKLEFKR